MNFRLGEGEEENGNHGWSGAKSFSQETEAQGQQSKPRMGMPTPMLKRLKVQDARPNSESTPLFYFFKRPTETTGRFPKRTTAAGVTHV